LHSVAGARTIQSSPFVERSLKDGRQMARTSNRRWKGCMLCKPWKHAGCGAAERKPTAELRRIGKRRRVSRHDLGDAGD
jgi:hypothetical protein